MYAYNEINWFMLIHGVDYQMGMLMAAINMWIEML